MKTRGWKMADGEWTARSVLECGSPLPLSSGLKPACATHEPKRRRRCALPSHSKVWRLVLLPALCFIILHSSFCLQALGQSYSIDWHTIDGGGGTSTGGVYSVSGTIGQPDAGGPMTNGQYSVTGGFWALPTAVQVTGAPTLTIVLATPGNATVSWTPPTPGFVLQESLTLTPPAWTNSPSGATNPIVVPATLPTKFYRLFKP